MAGQSRNQIKHPVTKRIRSLLNHQDNRGVKFSFEDVARSVHARLAEVTAAIRWLENSGYVIVHRGKVWWPLSVKESITSLDRPDYHCGPLADGNIASTAMSTFWYNVAHPKL